MNSLGLLKSCLQRWYRKLGMSFVLLALLTCFLVYNYIMLHRDLFYCKNLLVMLAVFFVATLILPMIAVLRLQQHLADKVQHYVDHMISKYHRRKYANFIMRRLLLQLELARSGLPGSLKDQQLDDPVLRQRYQLAKDSAYRAVDIFRRDASKLLMKTPNSPHEQSHIFVLREEELLLLHNGYSQINLNVIKQLLTQLLHPPVPSTAN